MQLRTHAAIAISLGCALLAAPSAAGAAGPCAGATASELPPRDIEASVTCLINAERSERGLRQVRSEGRLRSAAKRHSSAMVDQGFFSHTWPNGLSFMARIRASGFLRGARNWAVGENLAWGSGALSTAKSLVDRWMASPPHRSNILWPGFKRIGVAAVPGTPSDAEDTSGVTITTDFGVRSR